MTRRAILAALAFGACGGSPHESARAVPAAAPLDSARFHALIDYLRAEVDSGAFPGAVVAVGYRGRLALVAAVGHYGRDDPRTIDTATVFDLASLTKVIGLTTAAMLLVAANRVDLDAPVQRYLPEFRGTGKERVTIRHLLTHSSGLPAWRPLFREAASRGEALALVDTTPLVRQPGDTFIYSDLGAIVLTQVAERIAGTSIDRYLDTAVFRPLGMHATRYLPPPDWRDRIAPTEEDTAFRHRKLRGEVHDENTARLEGVSGHAGLFSTAGDLSRFAAWILARLSTEHGAQSTTAGRAGVLPAPCSVLCPSLDIVRRFTLRQGIPPGSTRALGWDTPADSGYTSAGSRLSRGSFGHTGFTGTSIWIDPEHDLFVILLTNRVHPTRANTRIFRVRPRVADLVVEALTSDP